MDSPRHTVSGRERREIRAALHGERAVVQVGKAGVEPAVLRSADEALAAREAIKIAIGRSCPVEAREAAAEIAAALGADVISVTGRTAILYRPSEGESPSPKD